MTALRRWGAAFCLVAAQTALTCRATEIEPASDAYRALCSWDDAWYVDIAQRGYDDHVETQGGLKETNVRFFPAYPLFVRFLSMFLPSSVPPDFACLLASQLGALVFWFFFLSMLDLSPHGPLVKIALTAAVTVFPSAFFMVAGYSESFFMAAFLAALLFASQRRSAASSLAGILTTASRPFGVILPAVLVLSGDRKRPSPPGEKTGGRPFAPWVLAAISSFGLLSFLVYCRWHMGDWDAYARAHQTLFGTTMRLSGFSRPDLWTPTLVPLDRSVTFEINPVGIAACGWLAPVFIASLVMEAAFGGRTSEQLWLRRALLLSAALQFVFGVIARGAEPLMPGMIRYLLPVYVFWIGWLALWSHAPTRRSFVRIALVGVFALAPYCVRLQALLIWRFARHLWAA